MSAHERRWRPEDGINLAGYFLAESGVGEHARTMLAVLDEAGIPVAPLLFRETRSRQEAPLEHVEWMDPVFPVSLVCVNADQTPFFFGRHPQVREGRYTIGYWHWEVEEFPDSMAASAGLVDEIWTASEHSRAAIARKVSRPVRVVPPAIDPPPPTGLPDGLVPPGEGLLFLCCFDYDSVVERKNPQGAIEAFRRAFPEPGRHRLLLKSVNGEHHADRLREVAAATVGRPDVHLVDCFLDRREQATLIGRSDVFVSLHRAEGFGLMLGEAMAAGSLVIATDYSGCREFLDESTGLTLPWQYVAIPPDAGPYHGRWAEPDIAAAAAAMARVASAPADFSAIRARARQRLLAEHSPAARAERVLHCLGEIELPERATADRQALATARDRLLRVPSRRAGLAERWRIWLSRRRAIEMGDVEARIAFATRKTRPSLELELLAAGTRRRLVRQRGLVR